MFIIYKKKKGGQRVIICLIYVFICICIMKYHAKIRARELYRLRQSLTILLYTAKASITRKAKAENSAFTNIICGKTMHIVYFICWNELLDHSFLNATHKWARWIFRKKNPQGICASHYYCINRNLFFSWYTTNTILLYSGF